MAREAVAPLPPRARALTWTRWRRGAVPYLFLLPFGVMFLLFFVLPVIYSIYESVFRTQRSGLGLTPPTTVFNGLANYLQVIHDPQFWSGVGRVMLFGVVQIPVMLGLALLLALILDSAVVRFKPLYRIAFFIPYAVPGVIAALLWDYLYDPELSPIVKSVSSLGLGTIDFLGQKIVLWSIANIVTWTYAGYNMLIIFAALQAIPSELYESARIDGASGWRIAWSIKIPLAAPALILATLFSIIGTFQLFTEPSVLQPDSTSITSFFTPNLYAYNITFGNDNFYYGATIAVVLALVTMVFSFTFLNLNRRQLGV